MNKITINLLLCGGTIDKVYFPDREKFDFGKSHIEKMIEQARIPDITINSRVICLKDSLDMDEEDRIRIARACNESVEKNIMVMHGTSTMVESAKVVQENMKGGKTVVFFGSMFPYEIGKSDAQFNFGSAITACQLLDPGTYITMNGRAFPYGKTVKNERESIFTELN